MDTKDDRVLIVEDNPLIAEAIERAGEGLHLRTDRASDGWDAIEKLESVRYSAIIIDADLPLHSGYGVPTYLRQENGEQLQNVILMTADTASLLGKLGEEKLRVIGKEDAVSEISRLLG